MGGGIRSIDDVRRMLRAGADKVSMNTAAVNDPSLVSRGAAHFGNQCIVVALDAKRVGPENGRNSVDARPNANPGPRSGLGGGFRVGGLHPRRANSHRPGRGEMGGAGRGAGRG